MLSTSLLAASLLALQTSAFLIPLEVAQDAGIAQTDQTLRHQVVALDCPGCPFAGADGDGSAWTQDDGPISLHLNFDITDDDQFLQVNGQPVFPPPKTLIPVALTAVQIRTLDQSTTEPLPLGYALEVLETKSEVTDISLTPIQLTILDLNGVPVRVDSLKLDVIQSWGHLHIARITHIPYSQSPGANVCTSSICRLRAIIAYRLQKMIDAAKAHAGNAKTWIKNGCSGRKPAQADTEQGPKEPQRHGHGGHRYFFRQIVHSFVLPALVGIAGGVAAGLVACALGMLILKVLGWCLWTWSMRRGAVQDCEIALQDDEKDALVENGEMPPQYENVDVIVVEDK